MQVTPTDWPMVAAGPLLSMLLVVMAATPARAVVTRVPVVFTGGHETDPRDGGRPVALVAGALSVSPDVFRKAFSGVTPARGRAPSGDEQRRNKEALLKVLSPYKVTNDRLDQVSDYYRYRPERGEMWPTSPAEAFAVVENGKILNFVVTKSGSGFSAPPKVTVKGFESQQLVVKLKPDTDLKKNGGVAAIAVAPVDSKKEESTKKK